MLIPVSLVSCPCQAASSVMAGGFPHGCHCVQDSALDAAAREWSRREGGREEGSQEFDVTSPQRIFTMKQILGIQAREVGLKVTRSSLPPRAKGPPWSSNSYLNQAACPPTSMWGQSRRSRERREQHLVADPSPHPRGTSISSPQCDFTGPTPSV